MGYFNYFIKCIIRKFVNLLFKPKILLTFLIVISLLFVLQITSRAEWTDTQISTTLTKLNQIALELNNQLVELKSINQYTDKIYQELEACTASLDNIYSEISLIESEVSSIGDDVSSILNKMTTIVNSLSTLNSSLSDIYTALDENQQELLAALEEDNQAVLDKLDEIKYILMGTSEETSNILLRQDSSLYLSPNPGGVSSSVKVYDTDPGSAGFFAFSHFRDATTNDYFVFEKGYTYTITCEILTSFGGGGDFYYTYDDCSVGNDIYIYYAGYYTQNNFSITITPLKTGSLQFIASNMGPFWHAQCRYTISKVSSSSLSSVNDNLNNVNDSINQGNQLQQEQNNFLQQGTSDSDVAVDGFSSVDANDITSDGLNGVFNNIYSSITSWNSKDISLPIPYTGKSIIVPANYTENMLSSFGGGWIITFVHAVYYFIVGKFMIYSITNIINSIKSGNILNTESKNNITTDML